MSLECATGGADGTVVADAGSLVATVDCGIAGQMEHAYAALLAPGGAFATTLTALLTVYIAIIGYRLILGMAGLSLGELVPHFIKIGLIVALTTSWASYDVLVFQMLFRVPEMFGTFIISHAGGIGSGHIDVSGELQVLFDRITGVASKLWSTRAALDGSAVPLASDPYSSAGLPSNVIDSRVAPPFVTGAPQIMSAVLWLAAIAMIIAGLGIVLASRVLVALLLVIGPCFIVMALFAPTRGIFEGWLRTTIKFALVPMFTLPVTAIFVIVIRSYVDELGTSVDGRVAIGTVTAIMLIIGVFVATMLLAGRLGGGIAGALRLPRSVALQRLAAASIMPAGGTPTSTSSMVPNPVMSRAVLLSQSLLGSSRRTTPTINAATLVSNRTVAIAPGARVAVAHESRARLGQTYRRRDVAASTRGRAPTLTGRPR